ncbi:cytochrome c biogenesis CcdA family protein [Acidimicrobiia bacterium EGI L10123]|uniref:cytochrome c biogenesis CcdA family protein n=1 Tax=Salinilacustrithrix flava TaxID=2957203 RepID=UPI003D7C31E2|nr:cytochrome c biogenesis CcdA family protein [Acidimicrobiia bacterium EGI L10123]
MSEVTLLAAFAAGTLALLSPCSALLVPSFFAYAFGTRTALLARTALFALGLAAVLVPLGMGSSAASSLVYGNRQTMIAVAGWAIIALGVFQALGKGFTLPFAGRLQARTAGIDARAGALPTIALGAVYGLAGFCSGPVLGAILTVAATEEAPVRGGMLLAVYALGMAAPLFVLAALWDRFDLGRRQWLRGRPLRLGPVRTHTTSLLSGALFVAIGALFLSSEGMVGLTGVLGDTTDLEFDAQAWISDRLAVVPDWSVPAVIAVVAVGVAWRRARDGAPEHVDR